MTKPQTARNASALDVEEYRAQSRLPILSSATRVTSMLYNKSTTERRMEQLDNAYHEAGHAVLAYFWKFKFIGVDLQKQEDRNGCLNFGNEEPELELECACEQKFQCACKEKCRYRKRGIHEMRAQVAISGSLAEKMFNPLSEWELHGKYDIKSAKEQLCGGTPVLKEDKKLKAYYHHMETIAESALEYYWDFIEQVAKQLIDRNKLSYGEISSICEQVRKDMNGHGILEGVCESERHSK